MSTIKLPPLPEPYSRWHPSWDMPSTYSADQMHAHAAAVSAADNAALRERIKLLEDALRGVLPWVVTQEVACSGLKCREPICMSCDSDSEANAQLACDAYGAARAAAAIGGGK